MSNNCLPFFNYDLALFCSLNGILHSRRAPSDPQLNGEAKQLVKTFKDSLKFSDANAVSAKRLASELLFRYSASSYGTISASFSQLLIGRVPLT